ncbi:MAG: hypothetical protein M1826_002387 [Phylliscum demangeonii]|nr:MAG: hypothetical protein M1826_002387 [Phylliscum demangeonii]
MSKRILVSGATGKQGQAVVDALLAARDAQIHILALTRDVLSTSARAVAAKSATQVQLVQGNLDDCDAIFRSLSSPSSSSSSPSSSSSSPPVWGVFSVQTNMGRGGSAASEERQGKALADAALAHGVSHFVYTSVDRHGPDSDHSPTPVAVFANKHRVELHLKQAVATAAAAAAAGQSTMTYTILRPTGFMENLTPDLMGTLFATMWKASMNPDRAMAHVATCDIGFFAAQAFLHPDHVAYRNAALSLGGDELSFHQTDDVFRRVLGHGIPTTWSIFGWGMLRMLGDVKPMMTWFEEVGYQVDIPALRKLHPGLLSWEDWLKRPESKWQGK